jgi:prepilin-type N-terminal cleavage/methylation domain-containing protein
LKQAKRAFTIVEMLVCLAIIGIIAALIASAVVSARKKAQGDVCLSNLRQTGSALAMYCVDFDDRLPYAPDNLAWLGDFGKQFPPSNTLDVLRSELAYPVTTVLKPYSASSLIFKCPLDVNYLALAEPGHYPTFFQECGSSYAYDDARAFNGSTLGGSQSPTQAIIFYEYGFYHGGTSRADGWENVLFADLHTKLISGAQESEFMAVNQ